jgi:hypothetical protein
MIFSDFRFHFIKEPLQNYGFYFTCQAFFSIIFENYYNSLIHNKINFRIKNRVHYFCA